MTDRISAVTVVLEQDIRDDDVQPLLDAIQMLKGVLSVTAHVADVSQEIARVRAQSALESKLWAALRGSAG
jgi:hypothetical protein